MNIVRLEIMPWLSRYFAAEHSIRVVLDREVGDGTTVKDLLLEITSQNREFGQVLFNAQTGKVASHISLILNGRLMELAGGLEAELRPGDTVRLLPAFSGG